MILSLESTFLHRQSAPPSSWYSTVSHPWFPLNPFIPTILHSFLCFCFNGYLPRVLDIALEHSETCGIAQYFTHSSATCPCCAVAYRPLFSIIFESPVLVVKLAVPDEATPFPILSRVFGE